jgi:chromate reductase, NAD(P)H dehydrogenase (quinone)
MTKLIGISGSLRKQSFNTSLLCAAAELLPTGAELRMESIADIGLYNADDQETNGVPKPVSALKDAIAGADGLLISTPEYNHSVPGVLKNAIDWASRPASDIPAVFGGLPVAVMGAAPGRYGTILAQAAWLPILRSLGTRYWAGERLLVSGAAKAFDEHGRLVDADLRQRLQKFMADFVRFIGG